VLLHGCGGFLTSRGEPGASYRIWAETLARHGYVALLVDSFGPRGVRSICNQMKRTILILRERVDDAYAALDWLASRPDVQAERIGLMGWSNGGSGALYSLLPENGRRARFRAAVAYYPGCAALARADKPYRPYAPLLVLAGEADDWTPAEHCTALAAAARAQGAEVDIEVYAGAHHGFDRVNSPVRFRPDVRHSNRPGGRGATVGGHPDARARSMKRALEFLARTLK